MLQGNWILAILILLTAACGQTGGIVLNKVMVREVNFLVTPRDSDVNITAIPDGPPLIESRRPEFLLSVQTSTVVTDDKSHATNRYKLKGRNKIDHPKQHKGSKDRDNKSSPTKQRNVRENKDPDYKPEEDLENTKLSKIVGGTFSTPDAWPWLVSIQYRAEDGWHHFCGGSLVDGIWIVTAAHCINNLQNIYVRVVLGDYQLSFFSHREQVIEPVKMLTHKYFDEETFDYDLGFIKLAKTATWTPYVQPITIATQLDSFDANAVCYTAGWGNIIGTLEKSFISDYLKETSLNVITRKECENAHGIDTTDRQVCGRSRDSSVCQSDSGGPLVCQSIHGWTLVGITSFIESATCRTDSPNVFTRTSKFRDFIQVVIDTY